MYIITVLEPCAFQIVDIDVTISACTRVNTCITSVGLSLEILAINLVLKFIPACVLIYLMTLTILLIIMHKLLIVLNTSLFIQSFFDLCKIENVNYLTLYTI